MLYSILLIVQVIISIGLITFVLLQHGKGADAGAAFGSGASSTVFGAQGSANFLSRTTAIFAALFFINSLAMAYIISDQQVQESVVDTVVIEEQVEEVMPQPVIETDVPSDVPASETSGQVPSDIPE
jgi:preprotein translocase subunit SecG